jgi:hypothetical protein
MSTYRYRLASNKLPKPRCPRCQQPRHWQRYLDTETGEALPERFGRCDNAGKCGHAVNPYSDGYVTDSALHEFDPELNTSRHIHPTTPRPHNPIPWEVLQETLHVEGYSDNVFLQNLLEHVAHPFDVADLERIIAMYYLGTIQDCFRHGAITFPYIDLNGKVRAIQVKEFDRDNHTIGQGFLHTMLKRKYDNLSEPLPDWLNHYLENEKRVTCFFGEHLLKTYPTNPVALVEAPKTAIYGTLHFGFPDSPDAMLWLAVYNLSSITVEKCRSLVGRNVFLFPDLSANGSAFRLWKKKAVEMQERIAGSRFIVSDFLENHATPENRDAGCDLGDFLIEKDWRAFRLTPPNPILQTSTLEAEDQKHVESVDNASPDKTFFLKKSGYTDRSLPTSYRYFDSWSYCDIGKLEQELEGVPKDLIGFRLDGCSVINDMEVFIQGHLNIVRNHWASPAITPYLHRLELVINHFKHSRHEN